MRIHGKAHYAEGEQPSGIIDGNNTTFVLANQPVSGTLKVYLNGLRLRLTGDYTTIDTTLNMINVPYPTDNFVVDYKYY